MLKYVGDLNEADLDQIQRGLLDSPEIPPYIKEIIEKYRV
jgi:hypothetical protein